MTTPPRIGRTGADCSVYWTKAAHLPIEDVVAYWCESSGHTSEHCRAGKRAAIVAAVDAGRIGFIRSDGRTFNDPAHDMAARGLLLIERETFDAWVRDEFGELSPVPAQDMAPKSRNKAAQIIAALVLAGWKVSAHGSRINGLSQVISDLAGVGVEVDEGTLRGWLNDGAKLIPPP